MKPLDKQSIIVLHHKDKDMLRFCLRRIENTISEDIEIVVLGNNRDESELDIEFDSPRIFYYRIAENLQYPKALNLAVEKCSGEIITFVDADAFVWDDWYEPMLCMMMENESIGVISPNLINPRTGRIIDFGIMYAKINSGHMLKGALHDHPLARESRVVQTACGAIYMTRKKLYQMVGGMDEDMPHTYCDCDYCLKLAEHGYETWVCAESKAYHKGSSDPDNSKSRFSYYRNDSKGMFGYKDYPRLAEDLSAWFKHAGAYTRLTHPHMKRQFLLIDITSLYEKDYYYDILQTSLDITFLDTWVITPSSRDSEDIVLYGTLPYDCLDLATPICYFVDTFVSLFDNNLWFTLRNITNDIVVDRHGNMMTLVEIASRSV